MANRARCRALDAVVVKGLPFTGTRYGGGQRTSFTGFQKGVSFLERATKILLNAVQQK
jgi:hypothetical protein